MFINNKSIDTKKRNNYRQTVLTTEQMEGGKTNKKPGHLRQSTPFLIFTHLIMRNTQKV